MARFCLLFCFPQSGPKVANLTLDDITQCDVPCKSSRVYYLLPKMSSQAKIKFAYADLAVPHAALLM